MSTEAFERLRDDILSGTIPPGAKLHIRDQCARLGIGLSPMREALNQLAAQGFAAQSDQRGFTAAPLNLQDLADLTLARAAVNARRCMMRSSMAKIVGRRPYFSLTTG